jgi:hypothetical protein
VSLGSISGLGGWYGRLLKVMPPFSASEFIMSVIVRLCISGCDSKCEWYPRLPVNDGDDDDGNLPTLYSVWKSSEDKFPRF